MPRCLLLLLALAATAPAWAQPDTLTVSFGEAVDRALAADVTSRDLALQERRIGADIDLSRSARRPALALAVTPSQGYGLGFDATTGEAATQGRTSLTVGGTGRLTLYDGGRTRADVAALRGARDVLPLSRLDAQRRATLVVAELYTRVLIGQSLVGLAVTDSAAQARLLRQVRDFVSAGVRPPADTLAQRSSVAGARRSLAAARQRLDIDRTLLARAIELRRGAVVRAVAPPPPREGDMEAPRPDVAAADAAVRAARLAVQSVRLGRAVSVNAGASAGTDFSSLQDRAGALGATETVPFGTQLADNRRASAFVTLSVPLLDGRVTRAREARARIDVSRAELGAEAVRLDAEADAAQARARLAGAIERLAAAREQAELAEAYADVQLRRYQLAAGSLFEWSDARARYISAATAAEEALHLLWLARTEIALTRTAPR